MTDRELTDPKKLVDSTLDEHRTCMQLVAELEAYLEKHADREGLWVEGIVERLGRLTGTLRAHFDAEERGPLFRQLPLTKPRMAEQLKRLESEHAAILEVSEEATQSAEKLNEGAEPYQLHELNARIQLLIAKIQRHEAEENEIVLDAHWSELGTGD